MCGRISSCRIARLEIFHRLLGMNYIKKINSYNIHKDSEVVVIAEVHLITFTVRMPSPVLKMILKGENECPQTIWNLVQLRTLRIKQMPIRLESFETIEYGYKDEKERYAPLSGLNDSKDSLPDIKAVLLLQRGEE